MFNKACSEHVAPSDFLSLDETLYPMRNHIGFKQYNPDKLAKYGMLFKPSNDARHRFTYRSLVYAGKPKKTSSPYYVFGTDDAVDQQNVF